MTKSERGTGCFCRLPEVMYRAEIRECLGECGLLPAFQNAEVLLRILSLQNECQLLLLVFSEYQQWRKQGRDDLPFRLQR